MNIVMMTNTYKPILGGLERSIETFTKAYREKGHRVIIVAPEFENSVPEEDVIRIPAVQNFNGTDFSVQLPIPGILTDALGDLRPDLVHSHHPFLVGDTALRLAYKFNVPLVFTHHTLYEQNTHYVPGDSDALKRFVIELSTGYANLADQVFAPSESVMKLIKERGVETSIEVVPTGIDLERFAAADGNKFRTENKIPKAAFVVGHLGRLAPEKNLEFLARAAVLFLKKNETAHFLVAGKGPLEETLKTLFEKADLSDRLHLTGPLNGLALAEAYHAMDVFVFASQSETQGLVLTEAMAAGVPVVAVDASGVREVVKDETNGRLLLKENEEDLVSALEWVERLTEEKSKKIKTECLKTAKDFSVKKCSDRALKAYFSLVMNKEFTRRPSENSSWEKTLRLIQADWELAKNLTKATAEAFLGAPAP